LSPLSPQYPRDPKARGPAALVWGSGIRRATSGCNVRYASVDSADWCNT